MTTSLLSTDATTGRRDESVAPDGASFPIPDDVEMEASFEQITQAAGEHRHGGRQIVVVQGLGFVGSAVAAVIAGAKSSAGQPRHFVIGVDLPSPAGYWKVAKLNRGETPIASPDAELSRLIHVAAGRDGNLVATASQRAYSLADVIVVDVPLDVRNRQQCEAAEIRVGIESFEAAIRAIGRRMRPDALVLIETTVPIGACERIVLPALLEERRRRGIHTPPLVAHAYERVMPGPNYVQSIRRFWRSFSGVDAASAARAREFLSSFIETAEHPLRQLDSPTSTELAKLLENSYRAVNIAFIHEWTLLAERMGVNLFAVVDSIRVRRGTHDNMRWPGFGVGGYCLTKDSLLAQWSATHLHESDLVLRMTLDALRVNYEMPRHTFHLLTELLGGHLRGKTIAVLGISYLPEVGDTRNSPTELLCDELAAAGATPRVHDPHVAVWNERPEITVWRELPQCLEGVDGIVLAVGHREYLELDVGDIVREGAHPPVIVDAQNLVDDDKAARLHHAGCRILGVGKGHWRKRNYETTPTP